MNETLAFDPQRIVVLGASFTTGNLGVSALAWSTLKLIRVKWPNASISLVGVGRKPCEVSVRLKLKPESISTWPVRYCPNVFVKHHVISLWFIIWLCRYIPFLKKQLVRSATTLSAILDSDLICDITGGDSFSDIYGLKRLLYVYLLKDICLLTNKPYILLPQTYGPFKSKFSRILARRVLGKATFIYSRDQEGVQVVQKLIRQAPVRLCPDVAFILGSFRPDSVQVHYLEALRESGEHLLGLNISGLLYHGGYSRDNNFGLAGNYPTLIDNIIKLFCIIPKWKVLLVPHVLPTRDYAVEDDLVAAGKALERLPVGMRTNVSVLEPGYNQNETKYFIGLCDFFIGSRMHATIAALSQGVPAVGLAYSRKFAGVFATAGVVDCVLDLRTMGEGQAIQEVRNIFDRRHILKQLLYKTIPSLQRDLLTMFDLEVNQIGEYQKNCHRSQAAPD